LTSDTLRGSLLASSGAGSEITAATFCGLASTDEGSASSTVGLVWAIAFIRSKRSDIHVQGHMSHQLGKHILELFRNIAERSDIHVQGHTTIKGMLVNQPWYF